MADKQKPYIVGELCPFCEQGQQVIFKKASTGKVFIYCDECEAEWEDIEKISDKGSRTHTFEPARPATTSDLENHPWRQKILNWPKS
jgi:hypothetical protein